MYTQILALSIIYFSYIYVPLEFSLELNIKLIFSMRQFAAKLAAVPKHDAVVISSDDEADQTRSKPTKVFLPLLYIKESSQPYQC